jgi:arylsulfatase A-like enzyme
VEPLRTAHRDLPDMGIPADFPTLPALLRDAGYRTTLIGKWHLGYLPRYSPLRSGYDEFFGIMGGFTGYYTHRGDGGEHDLYEGETPVERIGYVTEMLSKRACAHVRAACARSEPYFLSLHYTAPHWPWSAPSNEDTARVRELDRNQLLTGGSIRIYAEMMQILDRGIGEVIDEVRRSGDGANTLVLFTSDNGGERYSKIWPFVGRKFDLLEGGLRVPQIAWWPDRIASATVTDQVCITMDLTATCLEAAEVGPDPRYLLDGESLLRLMTNRAPPWDRTLYWRMANRRQRAVRRGDWKYLKVNDRELLFDLGFDVRERDDHAVRRPEFLGELRALWDRWNVEMLPIGDYEVPSVSGLTDMIW